MKGYFFVIARDKREAFAHGSNATKQSIFRHSGAMRSIELMDCFASLAMTVTTTFARSATPYSIPDSSSSACSINCSLTTTVRRGTRNTIVEAQAIDRTKTAALSGAGVVKCPPR